MLSKIVELIVPKLGCYESPKGTFTRPIPIPTQRLHGYPNPTQSANKLRWRHLKPLHQNFYTSSFGIRRAKVTEINNWRARTLSRRNRLSTSLQYPH